MPFSARITVRFADADAAGLVYYPIVFHYFHVAMEEFFAARCGTTYARLMSEQRIGFPTVNVKAEFFSPILYGEEVDVAVSVAQIGTSSVTFEYAARRAADDRLCARSTQVQVAMNLDTRRPVAVPDALRRALDESRA